MLMFTLFAHAGHSHKYSSMAHDDYHIAIIIGLIFLVVVLGAIIIMLLTHKHPAPVKPVKKTKRKK